MDVYTRKLVLLAFFLLPIVTFAQSSKKNKMGVPVTVGNFTYMVNNVQFCKTIGDVEWGGQTADGIYMIVNLSITNNSNKTRTVDNGLFDVFNSKGAKYEASSEGNTALELEGIETMFLKEVHPGIKTSGRIVFEVPSAKDKYLLQVTGGFWSGKTADIYLYN